MHFFRLLALVASVTAAPILAARQAAEIIPGQFIVVMKPEASDDVVKSTIDAVSNILGGTPPIRTHNIGTFKGFTISAEDSLIVIISDLADILYIEPDYLVTLSVRQTQTNAPWGLGRISHRKPGSTDYVYDASAGEGTYAYIIDTGIYVDHADFGGRANWGINLAGDGLDKDGNGHGTHVAGTTGGSTYGVAKKTNLIAVKVLDSQGSGTNSQVLAGIEWVVNDAKSKDRIGKSVANLSLGGPRVGESTNQAAAAAVKAGLFLAVAAGNDGLPAELFSPASEPTVCTVGATDASDARASFSNWGPDVDVFAPGVDILSTWTGGPDDTEVLSGTSMASPHVAGLAAYLIALEGELKPVALCEKVRKLATSGVVSNPGFLTPNLLAFNGAT
ncbi:subtilisin-like protein [Phialemonium atrogriseum]|uniref:Subtilisin-like protein n=1 Tax=Phialemonium atrogriseum TaxID=1093897 RepID=A0AAJ0BVH1_9PEZI|nr:subtilisin-like protein [Phialemonium atrogriseum]KAK1762831.1 subtilisin-like protein [Phialemonium atrogriseum]